MNPPIDMTLRDYFAAKAAQTFVQGASVDNFDALAVDAYKLADSMLKARDTPQAQPAPVQQEQVGRTDRQIVDQTEELAVWLLKWGFNLQPETPTPMRESRHPIAERCWSAACHIQEMLTATDPENSVAELDDAPQAQPAREPTKAMIDAAERIDWSDSDVRGNIVNMWQAMCAVAPQTQPKEKNT